MNKELEVRFWEKVDKQGPVHPELGPCWLWTGALNGQCGAIRNVNDRLPATHVAHNP